MNIMPRLLYPLQMITILLPNKRVKELTGWLSSFIWNKRKPRLKFSKLQLSSSKWGLGLPNIRKYQLACQLRFTAEWFREDPKSTWLDLEDSQLSCPLQNLLFVRSSKIIKALCENTIMFNTWKAWSIIRKTEGRAGMSPLWPPFTITQSSCLASQILVLKFGILMGYADLVICLMKVHYFLLKTWL